MHLYLKSKPYYLLLGSLMLLAPQISYTADLLPTDSQTTTPNPNPLSDKAPANPETPIPIEMLSKPTAESTNTNSDTSTPATNNEANTIEKDTTPMEPNALSPSEALDRLMAGNKRFVENKMVCPDKTQERRTATSKKQAPFAIILGCSDSRVSPELAFDQGVGDIFVVRTAGNCASPVEVDSVDYSVEVNKSAIIVVLGHERCGAVDAVFTGNDADIPDIKKLIKPTIDKVKKLKSASLDDAIIANIRNSMSRLAASPVIKKHIHEGKVRLQGGYYHLDTGKIDILPEGIVP